MGTKLKQTIFRPIAEPYEGFSIKIIRGFPLGLSIIFNAKEENRDNLESDCHVVMR